LLNFDWEVEKLNTTIETPIFVEVLVPWFKMHLLVQYVDFVTIAMTVTTDDLIIARLKSDRYTLQFMQHYDSATVHNVITAYTRKFLQSIYDRSTGMTMPISRKFSRIP